MTDTTHAEFTWRGKETIDAVLARLVPPARIEIVLPQNYNHALFAHLNPDAPPAQLEDLNIEGDVALLNVISGIKGLEDLAGLIGPLARLDATVTVLSPPKIVIELR